MKQKDILTLVVIGIVSGAISFFLSSTFLTSSSNRSQEVEVVEKLNTNFERPPKAYFSEESINPTQIIEIGPNESTEPFGEQ
jgi:hypothetical protein